MFEKPCFDPATLVIVSLRDQKLDAAGAKSELLGIRWQPAPTGGAHNLTRLTENRYVRADPLGQTAYARLGQSQKHPLWHQVPIEAVRLRQVTLQYRLNLGNLHLASQSCA